jgi:haloalkane dehalogenase
VLLNTVVGPPRRGFKPTRFHRLSHVPVVSDWVYRIMGGVQAGMTFAQGDKLGLLGKPALGYLWPLRHLRDRTAPLALARMVPNHHDHPSIPLLETCQALISGYRGPVSLVWGTRDPVLGGVISWLQKLLPRASVVRTEAGHFLQEEVPGPIAQAIREIVGPPINEPRVIDRSRSVN